MWHVTLTGHDPDNLSAIKTFTVRGESLRTLSARCRAAANWTSNVNMQKVGEGCYELTPSKRGQKSGMAKCVWVDKPVVQTVPRDQVEASMIATFSTAGLMREVAQRLSKLNDGLGAYSTKELVVELKKRQAAKASADQPDIDEQPHD